MPHRLLSSRLAAHSTIRQVEASVRADVAATSVDRAMAGLWRDMLAELRGSPHPWQARQRVLTIARQLPAVAQRTIHGSLGRIVDWGHRSARANLLAVLPTGYLEFAAQRTVFHGQRHPDHSRNRAGGRLGAFDLHQGHTGGNGHRPLSEADASGSYSRGWHGRLPRNCFRGTGFNPDASLYDSPVDFVELREDFPAEPDPGLLKLVLRALGLEAFDLAGALRPPAVDELSDERKREIFAKLLFPPPSLERIMRIIFAPRQGLAWPQRIERLSKLAPPEQLANTVAQGLAAGTSQREIAAELLPQVDGYRASARRIARTEGLRVAHAIKMETSAGLGDLVDGFQILAVLDSVTRPKHRARNGKTWYKDSGENMRLALDMEDDEVPDEPNCRCHLSEILKPPSWVKDQDRLKPFTDNADKLIPDPSVYSDWFAGADERRRRVAVGSRRYQAVQQVLGGAEPSYAHFVNPDTGDLLPIATLKAESGADRAARMAKVDAIAQQRRELIRTIATFGFHPERPVSAPQFSVAGISP